MMKMIKRLTALAVVTGAVMAATPAVAATPVGVTGAKPQAKVTILKPLTIAKKSDLDFGTILLPSTVSGTLNVKVDQAGVMTCGSGLTCATTAASVGAYTVTGTNFPVGGSFNIDSSTVDGVYAGDMNVTVEYQ
jgi:spore coat protein U-like protein